MIPEVKRSSVEKFLRDTFEQVKDNDVDIDEFCEEVRSTLRTMEEDAQCQRQADVDEVLDKMEKWLDEHKEVRAVAQIHVLELLRQLHPIVEEIERLCDVWGVPGIDTHHKRRSIGYTHGGLPQGFLDQHYQGWVQLTNGYRQKISTRIENIFYDDFEAVPDGPVARLKNLDVTFSDGPGWDSQFPPAAVRDFAPTFKIEGARGQGEMEVLLKDALEVIAFVEEHGTHHAAPLGWSLPEGAPRSIAYGGGPYYQLLGSLSEDSVSLTPETYDLLKSWADSQEK